MSQKRRSFSKISRWGSFETSCALAGNLWKNEMRRISGPSTSIFGRKFFYGSYRWSVLPPTSFRFAGSISPCIMASARPASIIAGYPKGVIRIVVFYLRRIAAGDCDTTIFSRIYIRIRCGGGYTFCYYITRNPLSRWNKRAKS